jgi:hypothetical protein
VSAIVTAAIGGVVALGVAMSGQTSRALVGDVYLLFLGGVTLFALVRMTQEANVPDEPSAFDAALRPRGSRIERLPELARLEREVALSGSTAFDVHYRLRPTLREIAEHRLATGPGVDLEANPTRARELLGEEAWELVNPWRPPPRDRLAPGISLDELRRVLDRLEAV